MKHGAASGDQQQCKYVPFARFTSFVSALFAVVLVTSDVPVFRDYQPQGPNPLSRPMPARPLLKKCFGDSLACRYTRKPWDLKEQNVAHES